LSIFATVATALPVLPEASANVNVKLPLVVKLYVLNPSLLVIVTSSSSLVVSVAVTFSLVGPVMSYATVPVGAVVSSTITVLVSIALLPDESTAL